MCVGGWGVGWLGGGWGVTGVVWCAGEVVWGGGGAGCAVLGVSWWGCCGVWGEVVEACCLVRCERGDGVGVEACALEVGAQGVYIGLALEVCVEELFETDRCRGALN